MAKTHTYKVRFNGGCTCGQSFALSFGATKGIELAIGKDCASIAFKMGACKTAEDVVSFKLKLFRDAYRKVHLLHFLTQGRCLNVTLIEVEIDDEVTTYTAADENFPFMFSMLGQAQFSLSEGWRSEAVLDQVVKWTKTASDTDYRCCAMNAYLASKNRQYRIDRFLNLWTAMNAVYNQNAFRYELAECAVLGKTRAELSNKEKALGIDEAALGALLIREFNVYLCSTLRSDSYLKACRATNRLLSTLDYSRLPEIYDEAQGNLENSQINKLIPSELYSLAEDVGVPLFVYLTFLYPYWLRCIFFHGSRPVSILSAFNDPEMLDFGISSYFLDRYLDQAIPAMFGIEGSMDEESRALTERYLWCRSKGKLSIEDK